VPQPPATSAPEYAAHGAPQYAPQAHVEPSEPAALTPAPRRSRRGLVATGFVLATLIIAALTAGVIYLWDVHSAYVEQNEALRTEAVSMGGSLAAERATVADQEATIEELQGELDEAKTSISDIVNGEAHAGDDAQALRDIVGSLIECADARQDLVDHLWEKERWTTQSLRANERSLKEFCDGIKQAFEKYKVDG